MPHAQYRVSASGAYPATYASILASGGVRRDVVERLMGHAAKGTTSLYTHLFRDAFERVEEALNAVFGVSEASTDSRVPTETDGTLRA
jgi:hypothetical protein